MPGRTVHVLVIPGVTRFGPPPGLKGFLVNQHLHLGVVHRAAEIIFRADLHLDGLAGKKHLPPPVFFRGFDVHLEFGQLVLFQPEQGGAADVFFAVLGPEVDRVGTERDILRQFKVAPGAAEGVEAGVAGFEFGAARIGDFINDLVAGRRGVGGVVVQAGGQFPVRGFLGPVGGAVRGDIQFPLPVPARRIVISRVGERLPLAAPCRDEHARVGFGVQLEQRQTLAVGPPGVGAPFPFPPVAVFFVQAHLRVGEGTAFRRVGEIKQSLFRRGFHQERRVGDEDEFPRLQAPRGGGQHVSAGFQFLLELHRPAAGKVFPLVAGVLRPGHHLAGIVEFDMVVGLVF